MGRNKNKNKLQLKSPSQHKNENYSKNNSISEAEIYDNENNFESSEKILNNPLLLNHINDIQKIDESVLMWNNEDVIDENKSKTFYTKVKHDIIKKSIKRSAFSKYLKSELKDINNIHLSAVSGVLMKTEIESDKSSIILNEIPNNNYLTIESKKQLLDNKNVIDLPEEIENVDTNCQQVKLSDPNVSPNDRPLRRSGRSAKINYKEMLNVQIYETIRVTDDTHSPKRKSRVKRESSKPAIHLSSDDISEIDNRQLEDLKGKVEKEEFKCQIGMDKEEKKFEIEDETKMGIEKYKEEETETRQFQSEDQLKEDSHDMKDSNNEESSVTPPATQENDAEDDAHQQQIRRKSMKRKLFRRQTKDPSRNCIICKKAVMGSRKFNNLCYNCVVAASKIVNRLKLSKKDMRVIVCLGDRGCWETENIGGVVIDNGGGEDLDRRLCDACRIQRLVAAGLEWGVEFEWMQSVTLQQLRCDDAVQQSRLFNQRQGEDWLQSFRQSEENNNQHLGSCILLDTDGLKRCKWDVRYLCKWTGGLSQCQFCANAKYKADIDNTGKEDNVDNIDQARPQIYTILPMKETRICHDCLLDVHYASRKKPRIISRPECPEISQENLLKHFQSICSLEAVKYRYFDGSNNPDKLCEICMRRNHSIISQLRSGNLVCLVCIWRIKLFHYSNDKASLSISCCPQTQTLSLTESCPINQCDKCLLELAKRVVNFHEIITHYHNPVVPAPQLGSCQIARSTTSKCNTKPLKRPIDQCGDVIDTKPKRQCISNSLAIDANWTPIETSGDQRPRRVIKATQFNDFIVDDKCLLRSTNDRSVRMSGQFNRNKNQIEQISPDKSDKSISNDNKSSSITNENDQQPPDQQTSSHQSIQDSEKTVETNQNELQPDINAWAGDNLPRDDNKYEVNCNDNMSEPDIKCGQISKDVQESNDISLESKPNEDINNTPRKPPAYRRIKQAICTQSCSIDESVAAASATVIVPTLDSMIPSTNPIGELANIPSKSTGPRVKQVSRQNVNAVDINLDSIRQKCVVKRVNRIVKKPESLTNFITDDQSMTEQMDDIDQQSGEYNLLSNDKHLSDEDKCGFCSGCVRNRSCGKCDPCLLNKSQRRKTEICMKMICVNRTNQTNYINSNRDKIADIRHVDNSLHEMSTDNADKSVDEITSRSELSMKDHNLNAIDVYRDSDSDDLSSEEEQLDPELDSIYTVKGDLITTALAHEGGFPVITTVNAQPNKVLCFSCGSGGDQLIHCVSCAEPFHFFCIEFQFRPKSKEMFVCRNCTKCYSCDGYGSDLKCIKCQLGFHPNCAEKYPPTKSDDRSNWACYKCAMCLHCGAKAEDAMTHPNKFTAQIDWSKDPWQCGRCARARIDGHVCPECGRAYQAGLETIECNSCNRMVHRQCSGLSEDDYEIYKSDPEAHCSSNTFLCSQCYPQEVEEEQKKRVRLKRQCKESGLKLYCERGVTRKMNEFIHKGETHEEMLLEQHNISDSTTGYNRSSMSINQYDGADDNSDKTVICESGGLLSLKDYDGLTTSSPSADMNQTNSTVFYSSESTGECDMEPLNILDFEQQNKVDIDVELENVSLEPKTKIGIFSRLNSSDFISPKHLLMEALARITIKLARYQSHNQIHKIYDKFIVYIQILTEQIFPWIDFGVTLDTVHMFVKKYSGRVKLILQALSENVRESRNREFDVFSASISEIEEKLSNSFLRGREEFIIFHSEQHLSALIKSMENRNPDNNGSQYANYKLAFGSEFNTTICEKDVRNCALCSRAGDDRLEGRLIYGGLDVWVHVNCALWSDDVFEREDGALVNVDLAIQQGETTVCAACQKYGATVRCSAQDSLDGLGDSCPNVYHFACAFNMLPDPVFTELRTFYCSESHDSRVTTVQQLSLVDMPILRRIYLPQGCLAKVSMACTDGLASDQIVVTIGNLRINCLGKIDACSDYHKVYLCPIGYQARRVFWSMNELDSLVMYLMSIKKELNSKSNADESSPSTANVNSVPPTAIVHRRRMIEMPEQRIIKRPKPMQCRQEIIYEMDEAGNLQPISGWVRKQPTLATCKLPVNEMGTIKKVNRRFPINNASCRIEGASISDTSSSPGIHAGNSRLMTVAQNKQECQPADSNISSNAAPSHQMPLQVIQQTMPNPPVMLRINQMAIQQHPAQSLPPSIAKQLNIHNNNNNNNSNQGKPFRFINIAQPISSLSAGTVINRTNRVYKIMKLTTTMTTVPKAVNDGNRSISVSPLTVTTPQQPLRMIGTAAPSASRLPSTSVLRTVLTDNSHSQRLLHQRPTVSTAGSSAYHISSCGSLVIPTLSQFDGEAADDGSDNASTVTTATATTRTRRARANHDYKHCLRFIIHGFKGSKSPKSGWTYIVKRITQMRKAQGLSEYALRSGDGWAKFGLDHRHVIYLVEQMVGAFQCNSYQFKFHKTRVNKLRDQYLPDVASPYGCARFTQWTNTKPDHVARDPLAFLHSKSNNPPKNHAPINADQTDDNPDPDEDYLNTLASQFRNLHNGRDARANNVRVCISNIHGRGLFARRQFDPHEIIIEYVGEVIRSILSDVREIGYQKTGVDCYMFRLDQDLIVDATFKGNAARFINHSCHPNCYAKVVRFRAEKHIIIIAQRRIYKGEELTYDYRFPIEDDKLPCTCGSFSCKKYLN